MNDPGPSEPVSRELRNLVCCISGEIPEDPVVSRKTGHVYERRLILRALEASNNVCPETGEALTPEDLLGVKSSGKVIERQKYDEGDGGVDGLFDLFREKWDVLKLELHQTRIKLLDTKKQLATSMYSCEMSNRTVARLRREKEKCEEEIKKLKEERDKRNMNEQDKGRMGEQDKGRMDEQDKGRMNGGSEEDLKLWPENLLEKAEKKEVELRNSRKARGTPESHASGATVASFAEQEPLAIGNASATSLVMADDECYAGLSDGTLMKVEVLEKGMKQSRVVKHGAGEVVRVVWDATAKRMLSGGDAIIKVWDEERQVACLNQEAAVMDLGVHAVDGILFVVLEGGHWLWRDLALGGNIVCRGKGGPGALCGALHPDGMVFGLGRADGVMELWDARRMEKVLELGEKGGATREICMSEKGYYVAAACGDEMRLFDLRKETRLCGHFEMKGGVHGMNLDAVGEWGCAVGTDSVTVFSARKRAKALSRFALRGEGEHAATRTGRLGCVWGKDAKFVLSAGRRGSILKYSGGVP